MSVTPVMDEHAMSPRSAPTHQREIRMADRLLAEAAAALRQIDPAAVHDPMADALARQAEGDFERKLALRARLLHNSSAVRDAVRHVRHIFALLVLAAIVAAAASGAAAVRAVLGAPRGEPVNIFLALLAILGLQTLLLIAWLALVILARGDNPAGLLAGALGGLILKASQQVASWLQKGSAHAAAAAAFVRVNARGALGKWTLSSISNAVWLAFNVGCLAAAITLLSTREYTIGWETTLLSDRGYQRLTRIIAAAPQAAGFLAPGAAQIAASQIRAGDGAPPVSEQFHEARLAWASLLVGSIVVYGFGPRLLLLGLCLGLRRAAKLRYRIDVSRPEHLWLRPVLVPDARVTGVIDAEPHPARAELATPAPDRSDHAAAARPLGPPAILGLEIRPPSSSTWPPPVHAVRWEDLGFVDSREDRRRVIGQLERSPTQPLTLAVVCSLVNTPDRGAQAFLAEARAASGDRIALVLTGGQALRERTEPSQLEGRVRDWRALAQGAGVQPSRVVEVDLDHLTQASAPALAGLMEAAPALAHPAETISVATAFDLIIADAERWAAAGRLPGAVERSELHRRIAAIYQDQPQRWPALLAASGELAGDVTSRLRASADRAIHLLPPRLRANRAWIAAGASAGALGCIAAATLLSPLAITALPAWSALGGALAAVMSSWKAPRPAANSVNIDLTEPVRSACLFALVLHLQGRDEPTISKILDQVLPDGPDDPMRASRDVRVWLDQVRSALQRTAGTGSVP